MFWATYVLMHAKSYVPGCGGTSDVIAMFKSGTAGLVKAETLMKYEQFAADFENAIQPVFLSGADETVEHDTFMKYVDALALTLKALRDPAFIAEQAEQVRRDVG